MLFLNSCRERPDNDPRNPNLVTQQKHTKVAKEAAKAAKTKYPDQVKQGENALGQTPHANFAEIQGFDQKHQEKEHKAHKEHKEHKDHLPGSHSKNVHEEKHQNVITPDPMHLQGVNEKPVGRNLYSEMSQVNPSSTPHHAEHPAGHPASLVAEEAAKSAQQNFGKEKLGLADNKQTYNFGGFADSKDSTLGTEQRQNIGLGTQLYQQTTEQQHVGSSPRKIDQLLDNPDARPERIHQGTSVAEEAARAAKQNFGTEKLGLGSEKKSDAIGLVGTEKVTPEMFGEQKPLKHSAPKIEKHEKHEKLEKHEKREKLGHDGMFSFSLFCLIYFRS